jgi:hypothetical protein
MPASGDAATGVGNGFMQQHYTHWGIGWEIDGIDDELPMDLTKVPTLAQIPVD